MKLSWLIAVSLAANIILARLWLKTRPVRPAAIANAATGEQNPGDRVIAPRQSASAAASAGPVWKALQSRDLAEMIRRLRSVGCPEETIQDFISAEVNREYTARMRSLWPSLTRNAGEYWRTDTSY